MKIALVSPYAWDRPGGVQTHIRSLAKALRSRGHETLVIAPTSDAIPASDGVFRAGHAIGVPANGSIAPISFGPVAAARVRRAVTSFAPDVLHLHEPLIPSLSLLALRRSVRVPAVGTFHAAAASSAGYRFGRPLLGRFARRLALRTAVSEAARALVSQYFPGDYFITPNGVDVDRFARAQPLDLPGERNVLFLSRIESRKGLDVLLDAMALIDDPAATLVVAGDGPGASGARKKAAALGVRAEFLGHLAEEDVPRAYRGADVYVAPGLHGESFGVILAEAMAAGCAVVCSDLPAFAAVVGDAALRTAPGDATALAGAIGTALRDREELGKKAAERAHAFDWSVLVSGVESLYERALG